MNKTLIALAALATLAAAGTAQAAITVDSDSFTYSQSFNSLTTSTTATPWVNNSTLAGWSLFSSTLADAPTILGGSGSGNAGSFYSFGAAGSEERALGVTASGGAYFGSPASGAIAGYISVAFTNGTGLLLDGTLVAFDGEQWRNGGNTAAQQLSFEYGFGANFGTVASWTAVATGDVVSPVIGSTAAAVDGNGAGLVTGLGATIDGWAPGQTLFIRWADRNDVGNDHGLSIDNFSLTVTPVPEPGALALMLAGLGFVGFVARRRA
jgi:hypothetical protein